MKQALLAVFFLFSVQSFASDSPVKPDGNGTSENPYLITRIENFVWLAEQRSKIIPSQIVFCKQLNDIDATETKDWISKDYDEDNLAYSNGWVRGFPQISTFNREAGEMGNFYWALNYDGQGFSIVNPFINSYDGTYGNYQGLFKDGIFQLSNIKITNIEISNGSSAYTGLLVGCLVADPQIPSVIDNCNVTGKITDREPLCAGLIGWAYVGKETSVSVRNSSADITLGGCSLIGGIIAQGSNYGELNIDKVECKSHTYCADGQVNRAAGLIANLMTYDNSTTRIVDSFTITDIDCGKKVGSQATYGAAGFVGCFNNQDGGKGSISITNCYSSGSITGDSLAPFTGGFIGEISGYDSNSVSVVSCYFNSTSFDLTDSFAQGTTEEEMKNSQTFAGWDFEKTWKIDEGESYPYLFFDDPEEGNEEEEKYSEVNVKYKGTGKITQVNGVVTIDGGSEKDGLIILALPNSECKVKKLVISHGVKKLRVDGDLLGLRVEGKLGTLLINGGTLGEISEGFAVVFGGDKTKVQVKAAKNKKTYELVGGDVIGNILCGDVDEEGNILALGKIKKITSLGGNFENGKLVAESVDVYQAKAKKGKGGAITNFTIETK